MSLFFAPFVVVVVVDVDVDEVLILAIERDDEIALFRLRRLVETATTWRSIIVSQKH